jgi:hypothetical protein
MKTIKHLKKDFVQLGNLIYKPYKVCDLPQNFGFNYDKENDKEGIGIGLTTEGILTSVIQ